MSRKTRKLIWSVPLIAAVAVIGALALFLTLAPNEAAAQDNARPGNPMDLTATADGPTIIKLDWDAPTTGGGATGYRIDISDDGMKWEEFVHNTGNSTTQYLHRDLLAREAHYYRVFGVNSVDTGYASDTVMGRSAASHAPEAPENLEAEAVDTDDGSAITVAADEDHLVINLSWQAPPDPVGAPVNAYLIEVSDDGERWRDFDTDDDLQDSSTQEYAANVGFGGETRYYRVSAMNTLHPDGTTGQSGPSNTGYDTTIDGPVPEQVMGLLAGVQPTSNDVWLYWNAMEAPLGTIEDDFRARIEAFMVGAVVEAVTGDDTAEPPIEAVTAVTAAELLVAVGGTPISAETVWSAVETISWSVDYEASERELDNAEIEVEAGQVWAFRVIATNKFGDGVGSAPVRAIMGSELAPRNPRFQTLRSNDDEHDGRSGLQLTWRSTTNNTVNPLQVITAVPGGNEADDVEHNDYAVEYRIEVSDDGEVWEQLVVEDEDIDDDADSVNEVTTAERAGNVQPIDTDDVDTARNYDSTEQKFSQRQLAAGSTKHYRIFAFTRSDTTSETSPLIMSVPSNERNGSTDEPLHPGRTRNLEALASGRTTIALTWERPEVNDTGCIVEETAELVDREDDGSECPPMSAETVITGYQIEVSDNGTSGWIDLAVATCKDDDGAIESPRCTYTHGGLTPDVTKYYRVFAMNMAGDGPLSNTALDTTHLSEFPDVPGGLTGDPYGATAVKLCWLAQSLDPADDPIHSYKIMVNGMDDPIMVMAATMGDQVPTQHMISGLSPETPYTFEVRAVNMRGESNQAATEMVTTPERMNTAPTAGAAIADQTVMVDATVMVQSTITDADTDDTLSWDATSDMTMYATAEVDDMGMVTITGVAAGMATIRVTATDMDGSGMSAMQEIMVTVSATPLETTAPMGADHSVLRNSISVTWDPNSAQNTTLIKVALFNADVTALAGIDAPVKAFNLAAGDPGAHTFNNVPAGTYKVVVAAVDSEGGHVVSVVPDAVTIN